MMWTFCQMNIYELIQQWQVAPNDFLTPWLSQWLRKLLMLSVGMIEWMAASELVLRWSDRRIDRRRHDCFKKSCCDYVLFLMPYSFRVPSGRKTLKLEKQSACSCAKCRSLESSEARPLRSWLLTVNILGGRYLVSSSSCRSIHHHHIMSDPSGR